MPGTGAFDGRWTYRSFRNDPDIGTPFDGLAFGLGTLELAEPEIGRLTGTLGGEGWSLALHGRTIKIRVSDHHATVLDELFRNQQGGILGLFNVFSGGALQRFSILALVRENPT